MKVSKGQTKWNTMIPKFKRPKSTGKGNKMKTLLMVALVVAVSVKGNISKTTEYAALELVDAGYIVWVDFVAGTLVAEK